MAHVADPTPVKFFVGILSGREEWLALGRELLEQSIGPVDKASDIWVFDETTYYAAQMGHPLLRMFVAFQGTRDPGDLVHLKVKTNDLERRASGIVSDVARPVNLDVGYLGLSQIVLASAKPASHRVYLGEGIYAEVTLRFVRPGFELLPWTYMDYRRAEYHDFFGRARRQLKLELKGQRGAG